MPPLQADRNTAPSSEEFRRDFFEKLDPENSVHLLFEHLPLAYLFVKNRDHRFVKVNQPLAQLLGCKSEREVIGKTDFDFHSPTLAAQYVEEDEAVVRGGRPLIDQVWLVLGADGVPRWYLSTKLPMRDREGAIVGIAGVLRPYDVAGGPASEYSRLTGACEHVLAHYGERVTVSDMASRAHLSVSQLQREFARLFGMSPSAYLLKIRLLMGRWKLEQTSEPVGKIALDCGFYDQSHFTRAFRQTTGLSPQAYRRRFGRGRAARSNWERSEARSRSHGS